MGKWTQTWSAIIALAVFGLMALLHNWIAARRPSSSNFNASFIFTVTSSSDHGPGSLREAIYAANTASGRARIILEVPRVELTQSLPPLVNPLGIVFEGPAKGTDLEAGAIAEGPVLEVSSPNTSLRGLRISHGPQIGILVRAHGFHALDLNITQSDIGVEVIDSVNDVFIEKTNFVKNRIGVRLGRNTLGILLKGNLFSGQSDAGIWATSGAPGKSQEPNLVAKGNSFQGNRIGAVVGDVESLIEDNDFRDSGEASVLVFGSGARILRNRIGNGAGVGVLADRTQGIVIEGNEVDNNRTIGVLVRYSQGALIQKNRAFGNAYGIALVLGQVQNPSTAAENTLFKQSIDGIIMIGDSPILRRNQLIANRAAGMRILDYVAPPGQRVASIPYLDSNSLRANGFDGPVNGDYRTQPASK
jgi:parallel beta-helix repeat protein